MLNRRMSGFTLIELMITLTILAILLMVGMPTFTVWQANAQIRRVAETLQNDLRQAQAEAIRRNRQIAFALTDDAPDALNPVLTPLATARNWALLVLPLLGSGEGANVAGSTGFILGHTQDVNSTTTITGSNAITCFNSVGRLVSNPNIQIANAGNASCDPLPTTTAPLEFNITNPRADRPLRIQVRLGGQIRMCDPKKLITSSPDGCDNTLLP